MGMEAEQLREHLCRPVRTTGPGEPWSPEFDVIDAIQRLRNPTDQTFRLENAATELLANCQLEIEGGSRSPQVIAIVARLGFLHSSLKLEIDGTAFFAIGLDLVLASGIGHTVDPQDLFQILRAAGRADVPNISGEIQRLFWLSLLKFPHKGIRTLSAQNLIRLDPVRGLVELPSLFSADVNGPLLAHELLARLGERLLVEIASVALGLDWLGRLSSSLKQAGYTNVVVALDLQQAKVPIGVGVGWRVESILTSLGEEHDPSDRHGIVVTAAGRTAVTNGLQRATRPATVERFMSHGGVTIRHDYVNRMAFAREDLRPPLFMDA